MNIDSLSMVQLEQVPWYSDKQPRRSPPVRAIKGLLNIPFVKRCGRYAEFYAWLEIIGCIPAERRRILDAACGRGAVSQMLFFKGHNVFACDIEDGFMADRKHIDFRLVDLDKKIPYEGNYFDTVIHCEALQYLHHPSVFIGEAARILRNRGSLILSVPNIHNLQGRYTFFRTGKLLFYDYIESTVHKVPTIIYLPYLLQLLGSNGFKIIEIKGTVPMRSFKLRMLNSLFRNSIIDIDRKDAIVRFSHSLVINAELVK